MQSAERKAVPGWMLDERVTAGRENLDADHAARYDAKEDASAASEVELLQSFGLQPTSTVIEFGPGTGQFTVAVAPECGHLIAVDVSPVMRAQLRAKCAASDVTNVTIGDAAAHVEAWCATGGTEVTAEWLRSEMEEHVRDEHSTFTWLLEPMLVRAGFEIERADYSADGFPAQYVARAV